FGYNYAGEQKVELVNFCVSAFGLIERPRMAKLGGDGKPSAKSVRPVYFEGAFRDTPIYDRADLPAAFRLDGPAVVEEFGSTTVRSPMIRESHDYRVGLFDRHCRKLTGRSYSAMPNAVVRDFPPATMRPGDVFLMNDTYLTEGSIGHLPDLCSTVPVFHDGEVVAYIQAFGHHDDVGGRVPGSMPGSAATVFEEGVAIPPVQIYCEGVRNDA